MTAKTMAEVLRAHWSVSTHADNEPEPPVDKCDGCGKVLHTWGDQIPDVHPLAAHQSAALSAAGFGLVADALNLRQIADLIMLKVVYAGNEGWTLTSEDRDDHEYVHCLNAAQAIIEQARAVS